jgi:L-ascorbate metabolism protein UlaG (beta-lactamase superfamily)
MTDGFFSRPSWLPLLLTRFGPNQEERGFALSQAKVKKVDAIMVAHSHHGHAMDSGLFAQKTGATVMARRRSSTLRGPRSRQKANCIC